MTLPDERARAVNRTYLAAVALLPYGDPKRAAKDQMVSVPARMLAGLGHALRHYPTPLDIEEAAQACPHIFKVVDSLPVVRTESKSPQQRSRGI